MNAGGPARGGIRRTVFRVVTAALALAGTVTAPAGAAEETFDRLGEALTFAPGDGRLRGRVSGLLDLEGYAVPTPPPGLIFGNGGTLFSPRLNVYLDLQYGRNWYVFAQARADRGFDPGPVRPGVRLDEYALRWTPRLADGAMVQLGKFATVVGNWAGRHASWSNPFITAPVPYEYLTGIWDTEAVRTSRVLLQWSHVRPGLPAAVTRGEKALRVPILWGPVYAPGAAAAFDAGPWRVAVEAKGGALSSRPEAWHRWREQRHHPAFAARVGYRPGPRWDFGVSAGDGVYLREFAAATTAGGRGRGGYRQRTIGHDVAFAWRHWQVWAEMFASRFEIPQVGDADTVAYYVETKYRFTPQLSGAIRWNEQLFATIPHAGTNVEWGHAVWRVDAAPTYRFTAHTQFKLQFSLQHGDARDRKYTRTLAGQFSVRF